MKFIEYIQDNKKEILIIFLILIFCIPAIFPLIQKGFFVTDDGEWMIIRFSAFYQAVADGQLPVRFLHRLNFDYGYPVATFLYPGFMYFGIPFHLLKIGFVETIKIILGISLIGTTLFTYFWLDKVFKNKIAALIGALVSLYVPYHLYDVYARGSIGEIFALLWIPFILWMVEKKNIFLMSIGIFLLLISHNTIALLFLPLIFIYTIFRKIFLLKQIFIIFLFGFMLSAFFIVPAIFELQYTRFSQIVISDPVNYLAQYSLIGYVTIFISLFALAVLFYRKKQNSHKTLTILFLSITFFSVFLSSTHSEFLWKFIPSSFIQFPFRLLSYLIISIAFLTAFIISQFYFGSKKILIIIAILVITAISAYQFMMPKIYTQKEEGFYSTNEATTTVKDEYMPVWVKKNLSQKAESKIQIVKGKAEINNLIYDNKKIAFDISVIDNAQIKVNTVYWIGWIAFIDGKKVDLSYNNSDGVIEVNVPKGKHQVIVEFEETLLRLLSDLVSILSLPLLILYSVKSKYKNNKL